VETGSRWPGRPDCRCWTCPTGGTAGVAHVDKSLSQVKGVTFDQDGGRVAIVTQDGLTVVEVPQD
jgi:hypothetical protein